MPALCLLQFQTTVLLVQESHMVLLNQLPGGFSQQVHGHYTGTLVGTVEPLLQAIPGGPKAAPGVNVILDLVGASHFGGNLECLTVEGKLLLVGLPSGSKAEINLALVCCLACCLLSLQAGVMSNK